jgi:hypothetical protein
MCPPKPPPTCQPPPVRDGGAHAFALVLAHWALIGAGIIANGFVGEKVVRPRAGEYAAHVYKTAVAVPWILAFSRLHAARSGGEGSARRAWGVGATWLGLSAVFELLLGHYVFRSPWERLIADYRFWKGRLWVLVLMALLLGPPVAARGRESHR